MNSPIEPVANHTAGRLSQQGLSIKMRLFNSRPFVIFHASLVVIVLGIAVLLAVVPFGSDRIDGTVNAVGLFTWPVLVLYFFVLYAKANGRRLDTETPKLILLILPFILGLFLVSPLSIQRGYQSDALRWHCHGEVVKTYNSSNHQAPSVEILRTNGKKAHFESVFYPTWQNLNPGDRIEKVKWQSHALVNGNRVRWVVPGLLDRLK